MRVGPLPDGRVLLTLTDEQVELARTMAETREKRERKGLLGKRLAGEGRATHLEGALAEVAVAHFYGAEPDVSDRPDGGIDFQIGSYVAQVKSRPYGAQRRSLSILDWDHLDADIYFQTVTYPDDCTVVLVGYATRRRVLESPIREVSLEDGTVISVRRIPEKELSLVSPNAIIRAIERYGSHNDSRTPSTMKVPRGWGQAPLSEAETAHLAALVRLTGLQGGVEVDGRRATLISALSDEPGMPPGCRVQFLHEREILRNSATRNNPAGEPVTRDYHPLEVKVWTEGEEA